MDFAFLDEIGESIGDDLDRLGDCPYPDQDGVQAAGANRDQDDPGVQAAGANPDPFIIRVLSWNICGRSVSEDRNRLVPAVVHKIYPDIMLLQETKTTKLINFIKKGLRNYVAKYTTNNRREAQILYDSDKYECINLNWQDRVLTSEEILEMSINEVEAQPHMGFFQRRVAIVILRMINVENSPPVIFMSFHNARQGIQRDNAMTAFINMVTWIKNIIGCVVVAGADFNTAPPDNAQQPDGTQILEYTPTQRRQTRKIDYFILGTPNNIDIESRVIAWDIVGAVSNKQNPLHRVIPPRVPTRDFVKTLYHIIGCLLHQNKHELNLAFAAKDNKLHYDIVRLLNQYIKKYRIGPSDIARCFLEAFHCDIGKLLYQNNNGEPQVIALDPVSPLHRVIELLFHQYIIEHDRHIADHDPLVCRLEIRVLPQH